MARPATRIVRIPSLALVFISILSSPFANAKPTASPAVAGRGQDAPAPGNQHQKLFPADDGSVLIDANGRVVLKTSDPQLVAEVLRVSAKLGGLRGLIEESPVIRFEESSEGLTVIGWALCPMCRNNFWVNAFIDERGQIVIEPKSRGTRYQGFREGLAKFTGAGWGFIDRTGRDVIPAQFTETGDFSDGLAVVRAPPKDRYGYIDRTGRLVIPHRFKVAYGFREGLALVILTSDTYAFIDRTGAIVLQSKDWQGVGHFSEDLALVRVVLTTNTMYRGYKEQKYGFMDRSGRFVIAPQFDQVESFSEGRALFRKGGPTRSSDKGTVSWGSVGFIDAKGQVVIQPNFVDAKSFSEGLAAAAIKSEGDEKVWGYIDRQGNWIIQPQFKAANSFDGGLAAVNCDPYGRGCTAYVDRAGQIRWQK